MKAVETKTIEKTAVAWFHYMGLVSLVLSVVVFALYVGGIFPIGVSPEESAAAWNLDSKSFLEQTELEFGSLWFIRANNGYLLSSAALGILASTALPTLVALAIGWLRRKDYLYATMSIAVSGVLIVAILGLF